MSTPADKQPGAGLLPGLTPQEKETLKKVFSSPLDIPAEWKAWLVSYLEANPPVLPIASIFGYQQQTQATRVFRSAAQSIPNGVSTDVIYNAEELDYGELHDTVTNPERLTVSLGGLYVWGAFAEFAANATGQRAVFLNVNGGIAFYDARDATGGGLGSALTIVTARKLMAGDYVTASVFQNSGGALNLTNSTLWLARVTAAD